MQIITCYYEFPNNPICAKVNGIMYHRCKRCRKMLRDEFFGEWEHRQSSGKRTCKKCKSTVQCARSKRKHAKIRAERMRLKAIQDEEKCIQKQRKADEKAAYSEWLKTPEGQLYKNDRYRLRQYGLTREQLSEMRRKAGGRCESCGREAKLCVDHCHDSGKVRGLLCFSCNTAFGHLRDSVAGVALLLEYAKKHEHLKENLCPAQKSPMEKGSSHTESPCSPPSGLESIPSSPTNPAPRTSAA